MSSIGKARISIYHARGIDFDAQKSKPNTRTKHLDETNHIQDQNYY